MLHFSLPLVGILARGVTRRKRLPFREEEQPMNARLRGMGETALFCITN
jgi:hypothetical protein